MLPITNEYARNASPPSFGGSRRHRRSSHSIPIILRRLFRFPQMDFEVRTESHYAVNCQAHALFQFALWQMAYLLIAPRRV